MVNHLEMAYRSELEDNLVVAIENYNRHLNETKTPSEDVIINLLCLYFEAQDPGIAMKHRLPIKTIDDYYQKMNELITLALHMHPNSTRIKFWVNYIKHFYYGEPPYDQLNEKNYVNQSETLEPFFAFYNNQSQKYRQQTQQLYEEVKQGHTCKERLIKSILYKFFK